MSTTEPTLICPNCDSDRVATASEELWMVNTMERYCASVKPHDDDAKALCLDCRWEGMRQDLKEQR